jgi:hypothetical protein
VNGGSKTEIKAAQIAEHLRNADALVTKVDWAAKKAPPAPGNLYRERLLASAAATPSASLIEAIKNIRKDGSSIVDKAEQRVLHDVRRGIQIGYAVAEEYRRTVGIENVGDLSKISPEQKGVIQEKMRTAAALSLYTLARYVSEGLADVGDDQAHKEHVVLPECALDNPIAAAKCALYYLSLNLAHPSVSNDKALNATVYLFFCQVLDEIEARKASFTYLESFQFIAFGIEGEDFTVEGLERHDSRAVSVEFNRQEMDGIVGNADAKHASTRLARRLACYNMREQANVFQRLGGLMPVWMGYGKPGTGKSMIIAAIATLLDDLCKARGIPFLFHPLPDNLIDSYQGNTARNMVNYMKAFLDPGRITFGAIDDSENVFQDRSRQGVSEGERAAIGVFLRYTEGAYAITRGNATIGAFTNMPEVFDPAVRSRIQGRFAINGAETVEDALDQMQRSRKKYADQPEFINLKDPTWYAYQSKQGALRSLADAAQTRDVPENPIMKDIFGAVAKEYGPDTHEFFARLYVAVTERYPAFSSRDLRNIDSATDLRVMDFDVPDEWFEKNDVFHDQDLARQTAMVLELRNANMKGLRYGDIVRQEWVRYLDNYATIADQQFDREVEAELHAIRVREEVRRRLGIKTELKGAA